MPEPKRQFVLTQSRYNYVHKVQKKFKVFAIELIFYLIYCGVLIGDSSFFNFVKLLKRHCKAILNTDCFTSVKRTGNSWTVRIFISLNHKMVPPPKRGAKRKNSVAGEISVLRSFRNIMCIMFETINFAYQTACQIYILLELNHIHWVLSLSFMVSR